MRYSFVNFILFKFQPNISPKINSKLNQTLLKLRYKLQTIFSIIRRNNLSKLIANERAESNLIVTNEET